MKVTHFVSFPNSTDDSEDASNSDTSMNPATPQQHSSAREIVKRMLLNYLRPFAKLIIISIIANIMVAGAIGSLPWFIQQAIDNIFTEHNKTMLWLIPLGVLGVSFVRGGASYLSSVTLSYVGQRITALLQAEIFEHLVKADIAYVGETHSGNHIAIFLNDSKQLANTINATIISLFRHLLTLTILTGVMFVMNWFLASIFIVIVLPAGLVLMHNLSKTTRSASYQGLTETGVLSTLISETLSGLRVVKAYGQEDTQTKHAKNTIERVLGYMMKSTKARSAASPATETLAGIAIACIIFWGGYQSIQGNLTAGEFLGFVSALLMAYQPLRSVANLPVVMQEGIAAGMRVFAITDTKSEIIEKENAPDLAGSKGMIEFSDVSFSYKNRDMQALKNVDIKISAGETVAFVGPSGAGKSTLFNLILRFFDVTSGTITIDGQDIREVTISSLREATALVTQEPFLFADTIIANIAYGSPNASRSDIEQAAEAVAAGFISDLPEGYNTHCGEGGMRLSGGQRQRIAIARAILKNAPILLLDEATSALDTSSEKQVQKALNQLMKNRTAMVIAHRLSTIMYADRIYVLEDGKVKQSGTHQQLLTEGGLYANLYHVQFEYQEDS